MARNEEKVDALQNETTLDPMEQLVDVIIPKTREKQSDVFVGLNGRTLQIKRGQMVSIPLWAKEILDNQEKMDMLALERQQNLPNKV